MRQGVAEIWCKLGLPEPPGRRAKGKAEGKARKLQILDTGQTFSGTQLVSLASHDVIGFFSILSWLLPGPSPTSPAKCSSKTKMRSGFAFLGFVAETFHTVGLTNSLILRNSNFVKHKIGWSLVVDFDSIMKTFQSQFGRWAKL